MKSALNCSLCSKPNQCAVAIKKPIASCWCHAIEFNKSNDLDSNKIDKASIDNARCICKNCMTNL